jgi:hypothetical protein
MTNDLIVKFARRLRITDRFAELVFATGNYYARLRMKRSDLEVKEQLQQASAEVERLCIEHAVMQDLLQNSSPSDRTFETAMERAGEMRAIIDASRKEKRHEREQQRTEDAAAALTGQELLHGES